MRYNQFKILEQEVAPNGDVSLLTPAQQLNFIKDNVMTLSDDLKQKVLDANQRIFQTFKNLSINVCKLSSNDDTVFAQIEILADGTVIPVVDVLEFNSEGKIAKIRAYRGT